MSKPIEPGCRCVVVCKYKEHGNGEIVTAISKVGKCPFPPPFTDTSNSDDWWLTDTSTMCKGGFKHPYFREAQLRRIDDDDKDSLVSWDKIADKCCGYKPEYIHNRDKEAV